MEKELLYGSILSDNRPPHIDDAIIKINGNTDGVPTQLLLSDSILSKHMMLIGGTGCGKTNTFFYLVEQTKCSMTENDVMIIFDTKGDYYRKFYNSYTDQIITTSSEEFPIINKWNVFREILVDGIKREAIEANVHEIAWGLFSESITKNNSNPFFPNAARDLFAAIMICLIRKTGNKPDLIEKYLDNEYLKNFFDSLTVDTLKSLFKDQYDQMSVMTYIGDGENTQGLGVLAELQTIVRKVFVGGFAEKGNFSIRELVRQRKAKTLFIEYDLDRGSSLMPIYKMLIDLALKESMGIEAKKRIKNGQKGNVYIFCDEFKLLPDLQHIEDAVNFGRSLGIKVFAGLQSIDQLVENYGEARAKNIVAGFSSVMSFRANDEATRQFTVGKYGKNYVLEQYISSINNSMPEEKRLGNVVEDWEICALDVGEAIIGLPECEPFKFQFEEYKK